MLSLNVALYLIGSATVIWSFIDHGAVISIVIALVWAALIFSLKKMNLGIPAQMGAAAFVLVASVVTILAYPERGDKIDLSNTATQGGAAEEKTEVADPDGTILVNGINGTLIKGGIYSNISNIERDNGLGEAYLGDDGATAEYTVSVQTAGTYRMWVKLSDDGVHLDGARNAAIAINGGVAIKYIHKSEDTKGWKWFDLGSVTLTAGENKIQFIKEPNTLAAYVMNQFKFVPLQ
jgi:hypothetical protein